MGCIFNFLFCSFAVIGFWGLWALNYELSYSIIDFIADAEDYDKSVIILTIVIQGIALFIIKCAFAALYNKCRYRLMRIKAFAVFHDYIKKEMKKWR